MAWNTTSDIKTALADVLKQPSADLPAHLDRIISDSLTAAYNDVVQRLRARGYSMANINSWVRRTEYERDIALWWCLVKDVGTSNPAETWPKYLDRRCELEDPNLELLDSNGNILEPSVSAEHVGFGVLDDSAQTFKRRVDASETVTEVKW